MPEGRKCCFFLKGQHVGCERSRGSLHQLEESRAKSWVRSTLSVKFVSETRLVLNLSLGALLNDLFADMI